MKGLRPHLKQTQGLASMAKTSMNSISYNSTGLDTIKSDWIRDLMKTCNASFFQLQKHFQSIKSLDKYFENQFPSCESFVIPGHRDFNQDSGREGGLAQLSKKSLDIRKERISSKNFRIQAQVIHFGDYRLLWFNAYFPTDPQIANFDRTELLQVQNEIENIMDNVDFDDVLLGGDFNYDKRRTSSFTIIMDIF